MNKVLSRLLQYRSLHTPHILQLHLFPSINASTDKSICIFVSKENSFASPARWLSTMNCLNPTSMERMEGNFIELLRLIQAEETKSLNPIRWLQMQSASD